MKFDGRKIVYAITVIALGISVFILVNFAGPSRAAKQESESTAAVEAAPEQSLAAFEEKTTSSETMPETGEETEDEASDRELAEETADEYEDDPEDQLSEEERLAEEERIAAEEAERAEAERIAAEEAERAEAERIAAEEAERAEAERIAAEEARRAEEERRAKEEAEKKTTTAADDEDEDDAEKYDYTADAAAYGMTPEGYLLACTVSAEVGWSPYETQVAAANVILKRAANEGSIRAAVFAWGQFAVTWDGALMRTFKNGPRDDAVRAAKAALAGEGNDQPYYYFNNVQPGSGYTWVLIGDEYFFY